MCASIAKNQNSYHATCVDRSAVADCFRDGKYYNPTEQPIRSNRRLTPIVITVIIIIIILLCVGIIWIGV